MSRFSKYRELVTLARKLMEEARQMSGRARVERYAEAAEHYAKARFMAGRITREEYEAELLEALDARAYPID